MGLVERGGHCGAHGSPAVPRRALPLPENVTVDGARVTVIVGPNGSSTTNLYRALRVAQDYNRRAGGVRSCTRSVRPEHRPATAETARAEPRRLCCQPFLAHTRRAYNDLREGRVK